MAAPPIVTRSGWGAATAIPAGRFVSPQARRFFVVHWPVMGTRDERQWVRDIERMHRGQGWGAAPGYNFLVGQSGTIYEGAGRDVRGIHSPAHNTDGWGVCVLQPSTAGGVPTAPISQAAKNSTRALYDWLCSVAGRNLNQWWHGRDYATACPGSDLRAWVQGGMQAAGPTPGPTPTPTPPPTPTPEPDLPELPEGTMAIAVAQMKDGRFEVFVETQPAKAGEAGNVWHTWQAKNGGWAGAKAGKRRAGWYSLGRPGS